MFFKFTSTELIMNFWHNYSLNLSCKLWKLIVLQISVSFLNYKKYFWKFLTICHKCLEYYEKLLWIRYTFPGMTDSTWKRRFSYPKNWITLKTCSTLNPLKRFKNVFGRGYAMCNFEWSSRPNQPYDPRHCCTFAILRGLRSSQTSLVFFLDFWLALPESK